MGAMSESLVLRGGRVIDPLHNVDEETDVLIRDGKITDRGKGLNAGGATEIDCRNRVVTPGLIDLHVHLREPGHEYKEDIESGARSAAQGGFTSVCTMPNTKPVNDNATVTDYILRRAREANLVRVYPVGAISKGLAGEQLADIGDMVDAGAVAISDDGYCLMNAGLMRRALEYARSFDIPISQHAEDSDLCHGACMTEGDASTRAGLKGAPVQSEDVIVARDVYLVELTGARYHVAHISSGGAIDEVRQAKKRGLPVTCEVTPHHFTLTDEACLDYDTSTRVNPPLRPSAHRDAVFEGLADGTIDCIATDHAPHSSIEKDVEFDQASPGMVGLETALGLSLQLVRDSVITLPDLISKLTCNPAKLFRLPGGHIGEGAVADVTIIDLDRKMRVDKAGFVSKSSNSPFLGWELQGAATHTIVGGRVVHAL